MLHRPILTHLSLSEASKHEEGPNQTESLANALMSSFALECARSCINAARRLIDLIYVTHQAETSDMWWWKGLCKSPQATDCPNL